MVILKGRVRDGQGSTESDESPVSGAIVRQGDRSTLTSSNGTFYTSADTTLNAATCEHPAKRTVDYSVPVFATRYDPDTLISGYLTRDIDTSTISGQTIVWDDTKLFGIDDLVGRIIEMRSGVDDGKTGIIVDNTAKSITIDGVSGSVGISGWGTSTIVAYRRDDYMVNKIERYVVGISGVIYYVDFGNNPE